MQRTGWRTERLPARPHPTAACSTTATSRSAARRAASTSTSRWSRTALTEDGGGYWEVASDGGIFAFGDAGFYGSMGGRPLNEPDRRHGGHAGRRRLLGGGVRRRHLQLRRRRLLRQHGGASISTSPSSAWRPRPTARGTGSWPPTAASSAYGDATFHGSMGGAAAQRARSSAWRPTHQTGGYWEVAADGGIFSFGAPFYGSTGSLHLNAPIVGMEANRERLGLPVRGLRRRHLLLQRSLLRIDGWQAAQQAGRRHRGELTAGGRRRIHADGSVRSTAVSWPLLQLGWIGGGA